MKTFGIKHDVKCNDCGWSGFEEELVLLNTTNEHNDSDKSLYFFKACPNCHTDDYLMDIE